MEENDDRAHSQANDRAFRSSAAGRWRRDFAERNETSFTGKAFADANGARPHPRSAHKIQNADLAARCSRTVPGFAYSLELVPMPGNANIETSVAVWGERIDGTARDMLAVAESSDDGGEGTRLREAKDFLLDFLMDGPKPAKVVQAAARDAGHVASTIRRAKGVLGIASAKNSGDGSWRWALPQGAQQNSTCSHLETMSTLSTFKENQRVRDEQDDQGAQGAHYFKVEHLSPDGKGGASIDGWEGEI